MGLRFKDLWRLTGKVNRSFLVGLLGEVCGEISTAATGCKSVFLTIFERFRMLLRCLKEAPDEITELPRLKIDWSPIIVTTGGISGCSWILEPGRVDCILVVGVSVSSPLCVLLFGDGSAENI